MHLELKITQSGDDRFSFEGEDEFTKAAFKLLFNKDRVPLEKLKEFLELKPSLTFDFSPYEVTSDLQTCFAGIFWKSRSNKNKWFGARIKDHGFYTKKRFEASTKESIEHKLFYNDNSRLC